MLVVLFQSWVDPFIIMMAVPGALIGIIWMLIATGTTINVVSLMGAIMTVGISVSNSILVVSFANDLRSRNESLSPFAAVIEAAGTRLRPILMTALAMIIGMVPMALGLGEAGEQNAPLGRAVIGGLAAATFATLFLVPIFYTLLRNKMPMLAHARPALRPRGGRRVDGRPCSWTIRRRRGLSRSTSTSIAALAAAAGMVYYIHKSRSLEIGTVREARAAIAERGPRIEIVNATASPTERTIKLLGDVRSGASTTLYAKVAGYLKTIAVDKGDRVEAGEVIAQIESPELEQQYAGASADLANKRRNFARIKELFAKGIATQVALNQAETDATISENIVGALETTKSYQTVKAPFAGRITARFVDPGALITNAQANVTSAMPMVTLSDDRRIRVYAYVQQADAPFVRIGDKAELSDASTPERKKAATVTRVTGELDQKTRTMLIEVHVDNSDDFFVPGSFVYVTLTVPIESVTRIPVTALLTRGDKMNVAVLDKDVVKFRPITVASTDGANINVMAGLKPGEQVAVNLPDEVTDGSRIQPVLPK